MSVHIIADTAVKLSRLRDMLQGQPAVSCELLGAGEAPPHSDAIVVTADLTIAENVAALKEVFKKLSQAKRRIVVVDQTARWFTVQAYAVGATHVLINPVTREQLLAKLADSPPSVGSTKKPLHAVGEAAATGAAAIESMFSAVLSGGPIDIGSAKQAGNQIVGSIAEDGLRSWLETVRRHHEGTYQHCLLVAGVAVDFGLSLGLGETDMERLYSAAMFHDIGKAKIPLAVLDKTGALNPDERALIETHPVAGYEVLKGNAAISPEVLDAVRHHHEYLDGSGYPDALSAASISDMVRILTICDIFAALIETRSYRPTMPREQAYEIIRGMHGKLEVPLVAAFKDVAVNR
jgi:putative nucleotidyltransferase with HDIG domain